MSPKRGTAKPHPSRPRRGALREVPSLYPTEEEFKDPISYLSNHRVSMLGAYYGMVKVIPPPSFKPPLSINKKRFRFVPRLQKLKELNLLNRCRMFFQKQLSNFNKMNNIEEPSETYAVVGDDIKVYYYDFFIECVKFYQKLSDQKVAGDQRGHKVNGIQSLDVMNMDPDKSLWKHLAKEFPGLEPSVLQEFYRGNLLPYFNFLSQKSEFTNMSADDQHPTSLLSPGGDHDDGSALGGNTSSGSYDEDEDDEEEEQDEEEEDDYDGPCLVCHKDEDPKNTLLCDSCNKPYHRYCLSPPLSKIPEDSWCCDSCVIGNGYYGFQDSPVEYSLGDFKDLSDDFDKHFFKGAEKPKDITNMEQIFWSLVNNTDNDVKINYGADIHNLRNGEVSGFPTHEYTPSDLTDTNKQKYKDYVAHPMNLNNLPFDKGSLLNFLDVDISGMTIPWIYVGNTFSTFCWHVEDQYTLSANYQHFGSTKKWYSIPSKNAEVFEKYMEDLAPDLFAKQPDILHQLITLVSPYKLLDDGIECFTANQEAGEYIITYPRVYHAGFNAGYNLNEAVNFTMTNWLDYGVLASKNYEKSATKSSLFDIYELMIKIVGKFWTNPDKDEEIYDGERELVEKCLGYLKPRLESEYSVQSTILDSLDAKPDTRYQSLKNDIFLKNKITYDVSDEERKFAEDGVTCSECKGFCTFGFVKHYIPTSRSNISGSTYLPTPHSSPNESNKREMKTSSRQSKRIKLMLTSVEYDTKILCLEDYIKLEEPNMEKDEFFPIRDLDEVKSLIQNVETLD